MFRIYVEIMLILRHKLRNKTIEIYLFVPQCARGRPLSDLSITLVKLDLRQAKNGYVWKRNNYVSKLR